MQTPPPAAKDPTIGVVLSLFFPGLGHLYAMSFGSFGLFLAVESWLLATGRFTPLAVIHVFQAIAAGGAVRMWNAKHAVAADAVVPPPPARGTRPAGEPPPPAPIPAPAPAAPPPPVAPAPLDADAFLSELQAAWREHRASTLTARQFADRKWRAIRAVRVEHRDEGEALLAAARELSSAGVLTSEEIGQLAARVAS